MAKPTDYFLHWTVNNNTYNQLINYIRELCSNIEFDGSITPFCDFGPLWNINARNDITFPLIWIEPIPFKISNSNQGVRVVKYAFNIYALDRINKGDQNFPPINNRYQYQELLSDMDFLIKIILAEIRESEWARLNYFILDKAQDDEVTPMLEVFDENTNGWRCKLNLRIPDIYNPCNIPIARIPDEQDCPNNYVNINYVECEYVQ